MITYQVLQFIYLIAVYKIFGTRAFTFHIFYSILCALLFELVNYIEHYGLERKFDPTLNDYEPVSLKHSWNAPQLITNYLTFKLQRHSDHHYYAYKPYQILDSYAESPMLPNGYTVCLIICIFPYIWFKAINPLATAVNKGVKLTPVQQFEQDKWIYTTLFVVGTFITYITFCVIGFEQQNPNFF